ncbi:hypothetical protein [Rhodobacter maris]|uniref:Uncharacterized protein n=1 Tax=Rhodobacter maris TaxID=446682 RepID=A0A285S5L0_9RHOB|nr:hypothetical protein [Rhodobacter maris]SOC00204.1 hypothetical protein SAMN05877831_102305 [Rhodobacter maris]
MKSALPLFALAALATTSIFGALSAAPIDAALPGTAAQLSVPAPAPAPATETSANLLFANRPAPAPVTTSTAPVRLADGHGHGGWFFGMFDDDDDDDDDDDHGGRHGHHGDHDGRNCPPGATNCAQSPAAAGTTDAPANGLFTPGTKPQVQSN